jgi:hypothetical protein
MKLDGHEAAIAWGRSVGLFTSSQLQRWLTCRDVDSMMVALGKILMVEFISGCGESTRYDPTTLSQWPPAGDGSR